MREQEPTAAVDPRGWTSPAASIAVSIAAMVLRRVQKGDTDPALVAMSAALLEGVAEWLHACAVEERLPEPPPPGERSWGDEDEFVAVEP